MRAAAAALVALAVASPLAAQARADSAERAAREEAERIQLIMEAPWEQKYRDAALAKKVIQGMDRMMVIAAWGEPLRKLDGFAGLVKTERWDYADGRQVLIENGKVRQFRDVIAVPAKPKP